MILTISLPDGQNMLKAGQQVDFNTDLMHEHVKKELTISLSHEIGIEPRRIFQVVKKMVGEIVKKGEILAESTSFFAHKNYVIQHDGIIKEINHINGTVVIQVTSESNNLQKAHFKGTVARLNKNLVELTVGQLKEYELKDSLKSQNDFGGETIYLTSSVEISEDTVGGKIVVADSISSYLCSKMEALGVRGLVSLHGLADRIEVPYAKLKHIKDLESAQKDKLPYCIIDFEKNKIYFYQ